MQSHRFRQWARAEDGGASDGATRSGPPENPTARSRTHARHGLYAA